MGANDVGLVRTVRQHFVKQVAIGFRGSANLLHRVDLPRGWFQIFERALVHIHDQHPPLCVPLPWIGLLDTICCIMLLVNDAPVNAGRLLVRYAGPIGLNPLALSFTTALGSGMVSAPAPPVMPVDWPCCHTISAISPA